MNLQELGYYLFAESEEIKEKSKENQLTEEEKVNLEVNPYLVSERATQKPK